MLDAGCLTNQHLTLASFAKKLCVHCVKTLGHLSPEKFRKILTQRKMNTAQR
jgi:hypothetical protein